MSNCPAKVFIKVETSAEQQENLKQARKTLKVLQKDATDKENLVGRTLVGKGVLIKSKTASDVDLTELKRKKLRNQQTQTEVVPSPKITAEDLTSSESPSEHYWEILAEQRRKALNETLEENQKLYERIDGLEDELSTTKEMLEEAKSLVEVLTEMLNENEEQNTDEGNTSGMSNMVDVSQLEESKIEDTDDE
uniref:Putative geminin-like protein n=1 Tax=Tabanus bromius TaxID=304241 RepID=A0A0K8TM38_TABBR